jgi:hypothetical protein
MPAIIVTLKAGHAWILGCCAVINLEARLADIGKETARDEWSV